MTRDEAHAAWKRGETVQLSLPSGDWHDISPYPSKCSSDPDNHPAFVPRRYLYRLKPGVKSESALDVQIGGSHYKDMKIQPIEYITANGLGFLDGNVIKYVTRFRAKGGIQDLEKARHYIDLLIETERKK